MHAQLPTPSAILLWRRKQKSRFYPNLTGHIHHRSAGSKLCTLHNGEKHAANSPLPPGRRLSWWCRVQVVRNHQQLRVHGVAGDPLQRGLSRDGQHRLRARAWRVEDHVGAGGVVRPALGPDPLLHGFHREVNLRHRRLRLRPAGLRRRRGRSARHAGGVHDGRQRRHGLLRRQLGGRVQPADAGGAAGSRGWRQLRADGMHGGPQRRMPGRPARGVGGQRRRRGVQERVRGVRVGAVLLQRRVRQPQHVPAVGLLPVLQERVPACLQLRLRRCYVHLHLRRRRHRVRHHLLPQHNQREVGRVVEPAIAWRAAAHQRHDDGVPRGRPGRCSSGIVAVAAAAAHHRLPRRRRRVPRACVHTLITAHSAATMTRAGHATRQSCTQTQERNGRVTCLPSKRTERGPKTVRSARSRRRCMHDLCCPGNCQ